MNLDSRVSLVAPGKLGTSHTHVGSVMMLVCKLGTSYTHVGSVMVMVCTLGTSYTHAWSIMMLGDDQDGDGL